MHRRHDMYERAGLYRFRFVLVFLGLFLARPALALYYDSAVTPRVYYTQLAPAMDAVMIRRLGAANVANYYYVLGNCKETSAMAECYVMRKSNNGGMGWYSVSKTTATTCPSGTVDFNGKCTDDVCSEKKDQLIYGSGKAQYSVSTSYVEAMQLKWFNGEKYTSSCEGGCRVIGEIGDLYSNQCANGTCAQNYVVLVKAKYTGEQCQTTGVAEPAVPPTETTPGQPATEGTATPNTCASGQCPGVVNGAQVCMACDKLWSKSDSSSSTSSSSTSASGAVSSDGSNTSSTSVTSCDATTGICTTKTTTTKTNSDGSSSSSTSTDTQSKSQYCVKNPWDTKQCGGSGSGSGSGSGDGTGDGEGDKEDKECTDTDLIKCMKAGDASGDSSAVGTAGAAVNYTPNQLISLPTGCPAPKTFQYFGKSFSFDYDSLCVGAEKARPFVLLLAAAFASIIVVLGLRK